MENYLKVADERVSWWPLPSSSCAWVKHLFLQNSHNKKYTLGSDVSLQYPRLLASTTLSPSCWEVTPSRDTPILSQNWASVHFSQIISRICLVFFPLAINVSFSLNCDICPGKVSWSDASKFRLPTRHVRFGTLISFHHTQFYPVASQLFNPTLVNEFRHASFSC